MIGTGLRTTEEIEGFGGDPWWIIAIKVLVIFVLLIGLTIFAIVFERKVVAKMQHRVGPNRVGPGGWLQSLADGTKLMLKEDIIPKAADKVVYVLAPIVSVIPAFLIFAVIPVGPEVSMFGHTTRLQLTDMPVAVLYMLAIASIGVYGIMLAGWSSGSTYPLLGGLRSTAQVISYELAMGLSFVAVFLFAGTMSTSGIVEGQERLWYGIILVPSFVVYLISMVGETNRAPFDLPEAEGELVAGFGTEYSSFKYAMFYMAEYINMVNVSAIATTLFLGGWRAPWPISAINDGMFNTGYWPILWFLGKILALMFVFVWLRGTLPRLRYDQFMKLGWKVLIPVSLVWIVAVAGMRLANSEDQPRIEMDVFGRSWSIPVIWAVLAAILVVVAVVSLFIPERKPPDEQDTEPVTFDPFAGGHPVPPLPGQQPEPRIRATAGATTSSSPGPSSGSSTDDAGESDRPGEGTSA